MLERELKFSLLDETFPATDDLRAAFEQAGYHLVAEGEVAQQDRYYDDMSSSLKKRGLALRRRTVDGASVATLKRQGKVTGALHERDEIELPLKGGSWPGPIHRVVAALTDPADLRSRLDLSTRRLRYRVRKADSDLALLVFDEVEASYPLSDQSVHFTEAEIEAVGEAHANTLQVIADIVDRLVRLSPNTASKLERAEALLSLGASFQEG